MTTVKIKKTSPSAIIPHFATKGSAGFDLSTAESVTLPPGAIVRVSTGLIIETPANHMLYITFRSSTPLRYGVTVLEGIVDSDYCGDNDVISLQIQNLHDKTTEISAGTKLAQGIFIPVNNQVEFVEADQMGESRGGFGSTG